MTAHPAPNEKHRKYARLARRASLFRYSVANVAPTARVVRVVDFERAFDWLAEQNREAGGTAKISMTHVLMKAVALALRNHIYFNYAFGGGHRLHPVDEIDIRSPVDLGEYPQFVVVRSCDRKNVAQIAKEMMEQRAAMEAPEPTPFERVFSFFGLPFPLLSFLLGGLDIIRWVQRLIPGAEARGLARGRRLTGSFMVSNPGTTGVEYANGALVQPSIAYVVAGAATRRPVVREDDQIEVRRQGNLICDFDHRFIDGAQAARFLTEIQRNLEEPSHLESESAPALWPGTIGGVPP